MVVHQRDRTLASAGAAIDAINGKQPRGLRPRTSLVGEALAMIVPDYI